MRKLIKCVLLISIAITNITFAQAQMRNGVRVNSTRDMKNQIYNLLGQLQGSMSSGAHYTTSQLQQVMDHLTYALDSLDMNNPQRPPLHPPINSANFDLICMSRDNDGRAPYAIGIRNAIDLSVIKTNLSYSTDVACQEAIRSSLKVNGDAAYLCASRDNDGKNPYNIYTIKNNQPLKLALTYNTYEACNGSLERAKVTPQVMAVCSSRDNDGNQPWSIFTINHNTNQATKTEMTYSKIEECQQNLY